ncbi:phosphoglycerate dehydrogenase-like enzyme [Microbacterium endophyticum]|nr:2-hydroxyacid dehydrogenase [Microbacterium endophyticum]NIK36096.1 phosphoglycerate dehydrogenase-like enzyme [Microbacterium endophyticum]
MSTPPLVVSVPSSELAADVQPLPAGVELIVWPMDAPAPRQRIDLVVTPYLRQPGALSRLKDVSSRLVQSQSIGYEGIESRLPVGTIFANAASVHETSTAELALALTLAAQRELGRFAVDATRGEWQTVFTESLADKRVLLLGFGGVGKAVAARLEGFEVQIIPVASRAREEDGFRVHGVDELDMLLPTSDVVILTLPGGESTRHIIGDAELSLLPENALIVNVGRGPLIDTEALIDHVSRRRIRAALDVTDPEPLPKDHPLWALPGVLISPHVGGATTAMRPRIARLVRRQIELMRAGEKPINVVVGG